MKEMITREMIESMVLDMNLAMNASDESREWVTGYVDGICKALAYFNVNLDFDPIENCFEIID